MPASLTASFAEVLHITLCPAHLSNLKPIKTKAFDITMQCYIEGFDQNYSYMSTRIVVTLQDQQLWFAVRI